MFFIGASPDRRFRAYETKTGRELWSVETEQQISGANPITYLGQNGKPVCRRRGGHHVAGVHAAVTA